jgi:hypothetical protein
MRRSWLALTVLFLIPAHSPCAVKVASPNGKIELEVEAREFTAPFGERKCLAYSIRWEGKMLVRPSPIWLELDQAPPLGPGAQVVDWYVRAIDESSELPYGKNRILKDRCNELAVLLSEPGPEGALVRATCAGLRRCRCLPASPSPPTRADEAGHPGGKHLRTPGGGDCVRSSASEFPHELRE